MFNIHEIIKHKNYEKSEVSSKLSTLLANFENCLDLRDHVKIHSGDFCCIACHFISAYLESMVVHLGKT